MTMQQLIDHYKQYGLVSWKEDEEDGKSFATISRLQTVLNVWIAPYWGKHLLTEVEALDVKNWLKSLPLARSYKCKIRNTLSALFSHARLYKFYSAENPIAEVKQSGKRMVEPGVLTKTQLEQLLSNLGIREQLSVLTTAMFRNYNDLQRTASVIKCCREAQGTPSFVPRYKVPEPQFERL